MAGEAAGDAAMNDLEAMLIAAVLRQRALLDRLRELKAARERCEAMVEAWRAGRNVRGDNEMGPCWKLLPPFGMVDQYDQSVEQPFPRGSAIRAEFVREHWCPSCQRNEPKVAEYYRLLRRKGALASTVARLARRVAEQRDRKENPPSCPLCGLEREHSHGDLTAGDRREANG